MFKLIGYRVHVDRMLGSYTLEVRFTLIGCEVHVDGM